MAQSSARKLIQIDASIDTVCPWCFMGKKNLDKAISLSEHKFDFEIRWYPFFLDPSAPKDGIPKMVYYQKKFSSHWDGMVAHMTQIFQGHGLKYDTAGLTGSTLDSHRILHFAKGQGSGKQTVLLEEILMNYFVHGKYIGDRQMLIEAASKVGIQGADKFLEDPNNGLKEVYEDLEKYSSNISGVPNFVINGKQKLNGAQSPEVFLKAFQAAI